MCVSRRKGRVAAAVAGVACVAVAGVAMAGEPCDGAPPACSGGYVNASAPGLLVPFGDGFGAPADAQVGVTAGIGGGYFGRVGEHLGIAAGLRFNYDLYRGVFTKARTYHVGPELRLGYAGARLFAFGAVRGGYSHWDEERVVRTVWSAGDENGGNVGAGGGLWGAVLGRLLVGAEVDADFILSTAYAGSVAQRVGFTLAIGAWI